MSNTKTATNAAAAKQAAFKDARMEHAPRPEPVISPAPWSTSRDAVPKGHVQVTVYSAIGNRVATVFESEANVSLVTAAPDLLAALKQLLKNWEAIPDGEVVPDELNEDSDWNAARAAIAKATEGSAQ